MLLSSKSCQKSESKYTSSTLGVHISNFLKNVQSCDKCIIFMKKMV